MNKSSLANSFHSFRHQVWRERVNTNKPGGQKKSGEQGGSGASKPLPLWRPWMRRMPALLGQIGRGLKWCNADVPEAPIDPCSFC
jgi:hypothetical protein